MCRWPLIASFQYIAAHTYLYFKNEFTHIYVYAVNTVVSKMHNNRT